MLLAAVEYVRPSSLADALSALGSNPNARALAGGQTLINVMKARAAQPDLLVDLADLEELRGISESSGQLEIGAMTTYAQLMDAMNAQMTIAAPGGERQVPASDFFLGVYMTAVQPGELLTKITIPPAQGDGFAAVTIGKDGTCIVNAAATKNGDVRYAIGCVGAVPATSLEDIDPPSDVHGSAEYRRHLAKILVERAVQEAGG